MNFTPNFYPPYGYNLQLEVSCVRFSKPGLTLRMLYFLDTAEYNKYVSISYFKQFICKLQLQILSYFRKGSKWPKIELVVQFWANCAQFLVYFGVSMTRKAQALRRNGISLRSWTRPFTFSFNFQTKTHISNKTLIKQPPKNPVLLSLF